MVVCRHRIVMCGGDVDSSERALRCLWFDRAADTNNYRRDVKVSFLRGVHINHSIVSTN